MNISSLLCEATHYGPLSGHEVTPSLLSKPFLGKEQPGTASLSREHCWGNLHQEEKWGRQVNS